MDMKFETWISKDETERFSVDVWTAIQKLVVDWFTIDTTDLNFKFFFLLETKLTINEKAKEERVGVPVSWSLMNLWRSEFMEE